MALPSESTLFPNIQRDADERGGILSIVDEPCQNVSIITCNSGAIRSNHYHLTDFHFMYVLEGEIVMQLDDDQHEITLRKGDTLVQRATNHAWVNRSDKHCRLFIVMVAGRITKDLENIIGEMPKWDPNHTRAG